MASIGHIAVGMAAARRYHGGTRSGLPMAGAMVLWSLLAFLPDADVIGFSFGIRYGDPWGHRGATHSLAFAVAVGSVLGLIGSWRGARLVRTMVFASAVLASHPLLDVLTTGGRGCALLWPMNDERYFAPWQVIPVAPIGWAYLSQRGLTVAAVELVLFLPVLAYALWPRTKGTGRV